MRKPRLEKANKGMTITMVIGAKMMKALVGRCTAMILLVLLLSGPTTAPAQAAAERSPTGAATNPPQIQLFLTLLADPKVQEWLQQQGEAKAAGTSGQDIGNEAIRRPSMLVSRRSARTLVTSPAQSRISQTSSGGATPV